MHFQWLLLWYDKKVTLWAQVCDCWCLNITGLTTIPYQASTGMHIQEYRKATPSLVVMEVMYFLRMLSATECASIRYKASATAFQVGLVVFSSQHPSTSVLQRLSSPRWFFSISLSWWRFRSRFTPSVYQSETDLNSFMSAFSEGVAGVVGEKQCIKFHNNIHRLLNWDCQTFMPADMVQVPPCVLDCSLPAKERLHYQSLALHVPAPTFQSTLTHYRLKQHTVLAQTTLSLSTHTKTRYWPRATLSLSQSLKVSSLNWVRLHLKVLIGAHSDRLEPTLSRVPGGLKTKLCFQRGVCPLLQAFENELARA